MDHEGSGEEEMGEPEKEAGGEKEQTEEERRGVVALHLPTPAILENTLHHMQEFNSMTYEGGVSALKSACDFERFNRLRAAQPIQVLFHFTKN